MGSALAVASGLGFGAFQSINRRAASGIRSAYVSTFLQLLVALAVLVIASLTAADVTKLGSATAAAIAWFAAAGTVHFFCGWTLLNISQQRIGAARTSPLLSTSPVFAAFVAWITLGEIPGVLSWLGIVLVATGAAAVAAIPARRSAGPASWRDARFGVGTALAWAVSPVLIRHGLKGLDSPLLGVTIGLAAAVVFYLAALPLLERPGAGGLGSREALAIKLLAGLLVGLATWARYAALDNTTIAVVAGLQLLSVPVVLLLSPRLMGGHIEIVGRSVWLGALLVIAGSLLLVVDGA
jgi:drug/metabolite transporter (DMT)-like permease